MCILEEEGFVYDVEKKCVWKYGEECIFMYIYVMDCYLFELIVYLVNKVYFVFKSLIIGKLIECVSLVELWIFFEKEYLDFDLVEEFEDLDV